MQECRFYSFLKCTKIKNFINTIYPMSCITAALCIGYMIFRLCAFYTILLFHFAQQVKPARHGPTLSAVKMVHIVSLKNVIL